MHPNIFLRKDIFMRAITLFIAAGCLLLALTTRAQDLQKMTKDATKSTQQVSSAATAAQTAVTSMGDVDKTLKFLDKSLGFTKDQRGKVNGILKKLVPNSTDAVNAATKGVTGTLAEKGNWVIGEIGKVLTPSQGTIFSGIKNETLKMLHLK
jgi:hypothetical protein